VGEDPRMRVYLGSDHAGFELKAHLVEHLTAAGHEPVDCGPMAYDPEDDYPPYCFQTGQRVLADPGSLGVVIGGSGNGEQIAANKVPGIRAALAWSEETARLGREHNDAQVVAIGARMHTVEEATSFVDTFLATPFSRGERHLRRLRLVAEFETSAGRVPQNPALGLE
jgi:ribose 5-phosphate isomerase B